MVGKTVVAGRAVTRIGEPRQPTRGPIYVYVKNGLLIFVETTEADLAEAALQVLP